MRPAKRRFAPLINPPKIHADGEIRQAAHGNDRDDRNDTWRDNVPRLNAGDFFFRPFQRDPRLNRVLKAGLGQLLNGGVSGFHRVDAQIPRRPDFGGKCDAMPPQVAQKHIDAVGELKGNSVRHKNRFQRLFRRLLRVKAVMLHHCAAHFRAGHGEVALGALNPILRRPELLRPCHAARHTSRPSSSANLTG